MLRNTLVSSDMFLVIKVDSPFLCGIGDREAGARVVDVHQVIYVEFIYLSDGFQGSKMKPTLRAVALRPSYLFCAQAIPP